MDQEYIAELILDERHLSCEENVNQEMLFLCYQDVHLFQESKDLESDWPK